MPAVAGIVVTAGVTAGGAITDDFALRRLRNRRCRSASVRSGLARSERMGEISAVVIGLVRQNEEVFQQAPMPRELDF